MKQWISKSKRHIKTTFTQTTTAPLYFQTVSQMPGMIFCQDNNLQYTTCSKAYATLVGLINPNEIIGKTDQDLPWKEVDHVCFEEIAVTNYTTESLLEPRGTIDSNANSRFVVIERKPINDENQNKIGFIGIATEITEQYNQSLNNQSYQAIESNRTSNIAHIINTPITGILGLSELLLTQIDDAKHRELLIDIEQSARKAHNSISQLLELEKLEKKLIPVDHTLFDLSLIVEDLYKLDLIYTQNKDFIFEINYAKELSTKYIGDPHRIKNTLKNLINSTIQYVPEQGRITLNIQQVGNYNSANKQLFLEFSLFSSEAEITKALLTTLLENVQTAGSALNHENLTNIELAITSHYLNDLKATTKLISSDQDAPNSGTTLTITLPLINASHYFIDRSKIATDVPPQIGLKILAVDDDNICQKMLKTILTEMNCDVTTAATAQSAITNLAQYHYDLIIMDIGLPDGNGIQLSNEIINELGIKIPIIAVTSNLTEQQKQQCQHVGIANYFEKPISYKKLSDILLKTIKRQQANIFD